MTTLQLKLALEAAECGTISAAAQKNKISQPNASASIKKLENELGYTIFRRENNRVFPTEQGYLFLEHAKALLCEDEALRSISQKTNTSRLRVGVMNYSPGIDAFLQFCENRKDRTLDDSMCINVSPETGIKLLKERSLDVFVALVIKEMLPMAEKTCKSNGLSISKYCKIPVCVRVRKDHPLILDGSLDGSNEGFKKLGKYPLVDYRHLEYLMNLYNQTSLSPFDYSYKIYVEERDTRLRALTSTDAYNIGCELTPAQIETYGLINVPTGKEATLISVVRKGDENLDGLKLYFELLKKNVPGGR